jgi:hypothetical protein
VTRNAMSWFVLLCLALVMLTFAATALAKQGSHVRPNDRGGIHGVGK